LLGKILNGNAPQECGNALRIHTGYHLAKETWFEAGRA